MRMSSLAKKGDKSKSSGPPSSKDVKTRAVPGEAKSTVDSTRVAEQPNPKLLPTAEQLRIAQMISDSKRDDPELPEKVNKLVELTNCSADAAIIALHDSNNDLDHAIAALLDGETEGDWEVSGKKKKPKQSTQQSASTGGDGTEAVFGGTGSGRGRDRDRSRGGRGGPPRLRGRGRGRDNKENLEDAGDAENAGAGGSSRSRGSRSGPRMSNGPGREGSGGRGGGRGGRSGFRRGNRTGHTSNDTWEDGGDYSAMTNVEPWSAPSDFPSAEDWDNEEYIGSLVETKVFTPSQSATSGASTAPAAGASFPDVATLTNGSSSSGLDSATAAVVGSSAAPPQVHYSNSTLNNSAQQGIDLNALLQKTSGVTAAGPSLQPYLYSQDALKGVGGGSSSGANSKSSAKPLRAKIPPPSKIPLSAVEMPDDPLVSGLDVKFGTLDFGIEPAGFDIGLDVSMIPSSSAGSNALAKQSDHHLHQQQQQHSVMQKMDQYGSGASAAQQQQPPAPSSLPKPDSSLSGFSSASVSSAGQPQQQQSMSTAASQVKPTSSSASSYNYGNSYVPQGVNSGPSQTSSAATGASQPAGAYPSSSQTSSASRTGGVYSNSATPNSSYQSNSGSAYASYGQQQQPQQPQQQQQQQQPSSYQAYNNKINSTSGLNDSSNATSNLRGVDMPTSSAAASSSTRQQQQTAGSTTAPSTTTASNKPTGTTMAASGTNSTGGLPNLPPGVATMLGPAGGFIMGQAPGLPYYAAAAAAAGMQQHPVYSLEEMQYRYPIPSGYYDIGYQSPTSLGAGREGTLASLAYAGSDAKFSRNENNSPVPTSLSQSAAQSHGGAFITPAAAAATPLTPAYAYYYSGGVMPGGYQFGAPAALAYPVSAAASGHAGSGAAAQYVKGGPLGGSGTAAAQSGVQSSAAATGGGPSNATASGYASYGSTYEDFSKAVYGSVSAAAGQTNKIGGVGTSTGPSGVGATGSADLGVGPNVYGKPHNSLGKMNQYDKSGGFHTGTPPPYGLAGNASGAPLGVGVSVGVGGPSPYGAQHMFIPTLAPHQSQHSHLMHQQLHQDSTSGPGQRSQSGGQQNKQGSKPTYGGSYWGSN